MNYRYNIHARTRHGVYRKVGTTKTFKEALKLTYRIVETNNQLRCWISNDGCENPHPRLYEFDPDFDTPDELFDVING